MGAVFLKLTDIEGDTTDDAHPDEIEVLNWSWGLDRSGTQDVTGRTTAGQVSGQQFVFQKYMDSSSPVLVKHLCDGQGIKEGILTVQTSGGADEKVEALVLLMEDVTVTSFQPGGSGEAGQNIPTESVTMTCKRFTFKYTGQKPDSHADASSDQGWDFDLNAPYSA